MFLFIRLKRFILVFAVFIVICALCLSRVNTIPATTVPLKEPTYTIVVDAGHGEPDSGAVSSSGIKESDLNLAIAKLLEDKLDSLGYNVIMTRNDENNIADNDKQNSIRKMKVSDINNRIKLVNNSGADLCISIHMNKFAQEKYYGWQTFYNACSEYSKVLAEKIQDGISSKIERYNSRTSLSIKNVKLIDESKIPTVIVECGFLSNADDLRLLQTDEYRQMIVSGIVEGIEKFYEAFL